MDHASPLDSPRPWRSAFTAAEIETALLLIFDRGQYRHRHVAKLRPLDFTRMQYQVSLDFTVPAISEGVATLPRLLVPVALVAKRVLDDVDLRDEHDASLPALNLLDEPYLTTNVIKSYWAMNTNLVGEPLRAALDEHDDEWKLLEALVSCEQPEAAGAIARSFLEGDALREVIGGPAVTSIQRLVAALASSTFLYAVLQDVVPRSRRIVKLHYVDSYPDAAEQAEPSDGFFRRIGDRGASFGFLPTPVSVPLAEFTAESFHLELSAPAGLAFVDGYLTDASRTTALPPRVALGATHAHLYVDQGENSPQPLLAETFLLPERSGWQKTAAAAATFVAVAVVWVTLALASVARRQSAPAAAGLFVAAGAVGVVFLAQGVGHGFTRRLLRGARYLLFANATFAAALIALLLLVPPPPQQGAPAAAHDAATMSAGVTAARSTVTSNGVDLGPLRTWRWLLMPATVVTAAASWIGPARWWYEERRRGNDAIAPQVDAEPAENSGRDPNARSPGVN